MSDPSGAVIPGASVVANNVATGVKTARQTTVSGLYLLSPLVPGEYTVTVAAGGFQTLFQEHVIVDALSEVGLNFTMKVGAAAEQVTITDTPPQLNTVDASLGQTIRNEQYTALPLAMGNAPRDPTAFIALMPGVQGSGSNAAGGLYGGQANFAGGLCGRNAADEFGGARRSPQPRSGCIRGGSGTVPTGDGRSRCYVQRAGGK